MTNEEKIIRVKTLKDFDRELARDGDETLEVPVWIAQEYDPREDRELLSFRERSERALAEVGSTVASRFATWPRRTSAAIPTRPVGP